MNLKLYESIILLILRILYDEKKRELSISDEVIVNLGDIQDKYLSLQIRDKNGSAHPARLPDVRFQQHCPAAHKHCGTGL